jgi:hypothetical protein
MGPPQTRHPPSDVRVLNATVSINNQTVKSARNIKLLASQTSTSSDSKLTSVWV